MKHILIASAAVALILSSCAGISRNSKITSDELVDITSRLTRDDFAGRGTGTGKDTLAAAYIKREFTKAKLKPYAGDGLQRFSVNVSAESGKANRLVINGNELVPGTDFVPLALTANSSLNAEVVFCGYGFMASNDSMQWNDYQGIDLKGKWALLLRGYPESNASASAYSTLSSDRMKVMSARENGAAGVLLVSGEEWDSADNLDKPTRSESSSGIPVLQIRRAVADTILKNSGKTLKELEKAAGTDLRPDSFMTSSTADGEAEVITRDAITANVAMVIAGTTLKDEYVVVGAHFDHLGMGGPGSSSRIQDTVAIHSGADDNASGVALMIELAEKLAADREKHARSILFVAFSGEEKGLLGSKYFVENMGISPSAINLMVNLDMVGRMKEGNGVQVGGVGTAAGLRDTVMSFNDTTLLSLSFTDEGYGPSDHSSFYGKNIPVLFITTGPHLDYHTPFDTYDKLNYAGMVRIGNLMYDIITAAVNDTARLAFREAGPMAPAQGMGRRRGVTLGIMPDFAGNIKNGLRADYVTPGRPAALGGMLKGDIIVAIDNKPVNDIEEYMFRLSQLKPGQTITVDVMRNGKHELLLIQL
jgi:aminopeptidase YwaD